jgi:hypothetical protein
MNFNNNYGIIDTVLVLDTTQKPLLGGQSGVLVINGSGALALPLGATSARPASPLIGMIRFNTAINYLEYYNSLNAWVTIGSGGSSTTVLGTTNQITASTSGSTVTLSLPQNINSGASPTFVGTNFSSIPNGALTNNSLTIGSTSISLGSTVTTFAGVTLTSPSLSGSVLANIIPRTGIHTGSSSLQSLSGGVGELASFTDWSGIVQFTGTANQAALYMPNGIQFVSNNGTAGAAGIGASATGTLGGTIAIQYITGGVISVTSVNTDDTVNVTLPNGSYDGQILYIINNIPSANSTATVTNSGSNLNSSPSIIGAGFQGSLRWNATATKWLTFSQPTYVNPALASYNSTSNYIIAQGDNLTLSGQTNEIVFGQANTTAGTGNSINIGYSNTATTNNALNIANSDYSVVVGFDSTTANGGSVLGTNSSITGVSGTVLGDGATSGGNLMMVMGAGNFRSYGYVQYSLNFASTDELTINGSAKNTSVFSAPPNTSDNKYYPQFSPKTGSAPAGIVTLLVTLTGQIVSGGNAGSSVSAQRRLVMYWNGTNTLTLQNIQVVGTDYISGYFSTNGTAVTASTITAMFAVGSYQELAITAPFYASNTTKWNAYIENFYHG